MDANSIISQLPGLLVGIVGTAAVNLWLTGGRLSRIEATLEAFARDIQRLDQHSTTRKG